MKYLITSNINLTNSNYNTQLEYFNNYINNIICKKFTEVDKIIILGGIFDNINNLNVNIILAAINTLKNISVNNELILVAGVNDYIKNDCILDVFENINNIKIVKDVCLIDNNVFIPHKYSKCEFNSNKIFTSLNPIKLKLNNSISGFDLNYSKKDDVINVGSPYQKNLNDEEYGIVVYDFDKNVDYFIKNNFSSKHISIDINTIADIEKLREVDFNKYIVDVSINKDLNDDKLKIDILLNEFKINKIIYFDSEEVLEEINFNNKYSNVDDLILEKIKDDEKVLEVFNKVLEVVNEKGTI